MKHTMNIMLHMKELVSAADWLRKINETAAIYNWQEKQIIYLALPKLSGLAKRWYEGLKSVDFTWESVARTDL
ncbi:Uncharacterized protein OBRU01_16984 [Operophtera brumata]|uniref:Uncharacterized protein n=1 Tax=Operophtera brumata TaxID=104452 RepID=A0A0L7L1K8_OPEBR|nr:Uncharacterized protein OBRU01_16984 [Operophtera brumata]